MAVTKTTVTYTPTYSTYMDVGIIFKGVCETLVTLGAITLISESTATSSRYDATYRLNGISSGLKLYVYASSFGGTYSGYRCKFYVTSDSNTITSVEQWTNALDSVASNGVSYNLTYYTYAGGKMHSLLIAESTGAIIRISWGLLDLFNSETETGFCFLGAFNGANTSGTNNIISALATRMYIGSLNTGISTIESLWGDGTCVAIPTMLADGANPWKGVNDSYFYQTSIYPNTPFSEFKIGTTDMFYLGNEISVIA